MKKPRLGKVQYQIMTVLWRLHRATARQITDEMAQSQPIAHSTVQTLLRQMEAKGLIAHDVEDRAFLFRPLYQPSDMPDTPLHDLLTRMFHGSVVNLMAHLLKHETISSEELAQLRKLVEERTDGEPAAKAMLPGTGAGASDTAGASTANKKGMEQ